MSAPLTTNSTTAPGQGPRKRVGGVVVPHQTRWFQWVAAWVIYASLRVLVVTLRWRWKVHPEAPTASGGGPAIYCTWHNRLALSLPGYYGFVRTLSAGTGIAAIVSASKDGAFLAGILECFGVQPVRGSSSRRGPQALLELVSWAERGYDLAITPDGPRGPCYVVQEGVMSLAQITGLPVVPFSYSTRWKVQVKSWDRFIIPLPFALCEMAVGQPIRVPRGATTEERRALRLQLENTMKELGGDL